MLGSDFPPCSSSTPRDKNAKRNRPMNIAKPIDEYWPRFLMIEESDPNKPFKGNANIFAITKGVIGNAGEYKSMKQLKSGSYLVEMTQKIHSELLLKTTNIAGVPVKVSPHRSLNSSRCVIHCRELNNMDVEEIKNELESQGITKVERMKRRKDGQLVPADSYILTCNTPTIPNEIKIGYLKRNTHIYIPNPQRCFKCQRYGHSKNNCRKEQRCAKCGQDHEDHECDNEHQCVNCGGDHPAYYKSCPHWKKEKDILKIKFEQNISFGEARQRYDQLNPDTSRELYATVANTERPWSNDMRLPTEFNSEYDYLRYLVGYCHERLRVLERDGTATQANTLDEIAISNNHPLSLSVEGATGLSQEQSTNLDDSDDMDIVPASAKRNLSSSEDESVYSNPNKKLSALEQTNIELRKSFLKKQGSAEGDTASKLTGNPLPKSSRDVNPSGKLQPNSTPKGGVKPRETTKSSGGAGGSGRRAEQSASSGQGRPALNRQPIKPPDKNEDKKKKKENKNK